MARLVVLKFEDNKEAEEFVENQLFVADDKSNMYKVYPEVMGLLAYPTQFCDGTCGRGRVRPYTRGTTFGWWVCARCKKPAKTTGEKLWRQVCAQAVNLFTKSERPAEVATVFDEGWGAFGRN